jgi:hypothetical protein
LSRKSWSDEEHLLAAAAEHRCIVTIDRRDFALLTSRFERENQPHAGVLCLAPSLPANRFAQIASALLAYSELHPDGLPPYCVDFLRAEVD